MNTSSVLDFARAVQAEASFLHDAMNDNLQCINLKNATEEEQKAVNNLYGISVSLGNLAAQALAYAERVDQASMEEAKRLEG